MMYSYVRETLEKQLQLLSERSKDSISDSDLYNLTCAMVMVAELLVDGT